MRNAIHPHTKKTITVSDYIKDFGNDSQRELKDFPFCPFCNQRMTIVAKSTANSTGHFKHFPNSNFCPSKEKSGIPYANLQPLNPDAKHAEELKKIFVSNWQAHFSQIDFLVKGLSKKEFLTLLTLANRARIWEYAHLEEFQIPFILSTLMDFPPQNSRNDKDKQKIRKYYFRCFFDSTVQRYDDLWIYQPTSIQFWRAWYQTEANRKPRIEDLYNAYPFEMSAKFLENRHWVPPFYVKEIQEWLNQTYGTGL